jgi:ABC-type amino acid transport system permease subunit
LDYTPLLIQIVIAAIILAPVLHKVGKWFVGKNKAKFSDALWIGVLGVVINAGISFFLGGLLGATLGTLIMIVVWITLIKHFFDCGTIKALGIAIIAGIIYWIITGILSIILEVIS